MSSTAAAVRKVAVILGAGPGTGAGIAKAFSATHHLALLSRSSTTLDKTIASLPPTASAHPFPNTDAADEASIKAAFEGIKSQWPDAEIDVAVFNPGGSFAPGPFLEKSVDDLRKNLEGGVLGAFVFSQCFLRNVPSSGGTLLFTGATMSIRGGAKFGTMAPSKFALRALSQSLAREFGPKNVHVAHIIVDGLIDTERVKGMAGEAKEPGSRLDPEAIGKAYYYLYQQDPSAWTQELDLRGDLPSSHPRHNDEHTAAISPDLTIAYRTAGDPSHPCLLLIHGYPQTSYMYRHVMDPLAAAGYYVVAPDYRGAGGSSVTEGGYDKFTMARDLRALYAEVLGVKKVVVVGIDIGSMVATALALQYRDEVVALLASECPQPGTSGYQIATTDDSWKYERVFHFFFHNAPNQWAEHLTAGKERFYIKSFYDRLANDPSFLTEQDIDVYEKAFTRPGAMHAGFEVYRAFLQDGEDVQKNVKERGKLRMPVLASGGESSPLTELSERQMKELAENVTFRVVPKAMHWLPEENPEGFVKVLVDWLKDLRIGA